jgi:hypothetical protein
MLCGVIGFSSVGSKLSKCSKRKRTARGSIAYFPSQKKSSLLGCCHPTGVGGRLMMENSPEVIFFFFASEKGSGDRREGRHLCGNQSYSLPASGR